TRIAAIVLALARPGLTVVEPGEEAAALATIPVGVLDKISACGVASEASGPARGSREPLRSANARSNRAGGGAPAQVTEGGAPRGVKSACGVASEASRPARDSREPLRSANAL